ncbi:MAG TPA: CehA/McbA family metallohydrolase, partial [bacterium]|nr:CehA/McbA family metallohydrolase [bacterium]
VQNSVSKYVINRGMWSDADLRIRGLTGEEFWNFEAAPPKEAIDQWVRMLLEGGKLPAIGGSDAHGDFNSPTGIGKVRTIAKVGKNVSVRSVISALAAGRSVLTSGPFLEITIVNEKKQSAGVGDSIKGKRLRVDVAALSNADSGRIEEIRIYRGDTVKKTETLEKTISTDPGDGGMKIVRASAVTLAGGAGYIRAEASAAAGDGKTFAFTNPVWTEP